MNYQPLFDLMSQHGLTLLEGEMEEIVDVVNGMQQPKQKKLTLGQFSHIWESSERVVNIYSDLLPYLADEQPKVEPTYIPNESVEDFNKRIGKHLNSLPTKPEPSRLEVAMMIYAHGSMNQDIAVQLADELIKLAKG